MVEVGFLEHLAQLGGAQMPGQGLFFKIVQVMIVGFAVMRVTGQIELLAFDDLFNDVTAAGFVV